MNNEAYFNELSLKNKPNDYSICEHLKDCRKFLKDNKFNICRARHEDIVDIISYIGSIDGVSKKNAMDYIYSFFKSPFEKDEDEVETDNYLLKNLYYNGEVVDGLHWTQIYDTVSLSLCTEEKWNISILDLFDNEGKNYSVRNVSTGENCLKHMKWFKDQQEIILVPTDKVPCEKKFHVRADHGADILKEYWKHLSKCEYVECCINSLPFNSRETKLIRKVCSNGRIEIVLHWEDVGYGMLIQSTGRSVRETEKIAELICDRYDR